jgi:exodeoxyribonuclease VII large subunit
MALSPAPGQPPVLSVSDLNRLARETLEQSFPLLWVAGEISNLTRAASGHWYFSLKDERAQVRCAMFRSRNAALDWQPREGDHVEARALVTLYEARGEFQLTVESLRRAGLGALFEAFERLKARLEAEGLFDAARKRALPRHPRRIGIVTSPDAAALRDVLTTLRRRMPAIPVVIYPTPVQGKGAAALIAAAIRAAGERAECDVLIVCRGGGSMEDLWQFNEEVVARAIVASPMPVVSGIGHETDFTIADFAADLRAPTPTAAAELVAPDQAALLAQLAQLRTRMARQMKNALAQRMQHLDHLSRRLLSPLQQLAQRQSHLAQIALRLQHATARSLSQRQERLARLAQNLAHLNPHGVLGRGYALVQTTDGQIVRSNRELSPGQLLGLTLAEGQAEVQVTRTED